MFYIARCPRDFANRSDDGRPLIRFCAGTPKAGKRSNLGQWSRGSSLQGFQPALQVTSLAFIADKR